MQHADQVENGVFGMDADVLTIDRGNDLLNWNVTGTLPEGELKRTNLRDALAESPSRGSRAK